MKLIKVTAWLGVITVLETHTNTLQRCEMVMILGLTILEVKERSGES